MRPCEWILLFVCLFVFANQYDENNVIDVFKKFFFFCVCVCVCVCVLFRLFVFFLLLLLFNTISIHL